MGPDEADQIAGDIFDAVARQCGEGLVDLQDVSGAVRDADADKRVEGQCSDPLALDGAPAFGDVHENEPARPCWARRVSHQLFAQDDVANDAVPPHQIEPAVVEILVPGCDHLGVQTRQALRGEPIIRNGLADKLLALPAEPGEGHIVDAHDLAIGCRSIAAERHQLIEGIDLGLERVEPLQGIRYVCGGTGVRSFTSTRQGLGHLRLHPKISDSVAFVAAARNPCSATATAAVKSAPGF